MDDGWQHWLDEKHDATPSRRSLPLPWTWPSPRRERCDAASPRRVVDTISWLRDGLAERHGAFKIAANPLRWQKLVIVAAAAAVAAALGEGPRQHLAAQIAQSRGHRVGGGRACVASANHCCIKAANVNFSMQKGPVADIRGPHKTIVGCSTGLYVALDFAAVSSE